MGNRAKIHALGHYAHSLAHDSYIAINTAVETDADLETYGECETLILDGTQAMARVCAKLKAQIGADAYASWFGRLKLVELTRHQVCLSVPTAFLRSWINNHYFQLLNALWREEYPSVLRVEIVVRGVQRTAPSQNRSEESSSLAPQLKRQDDGAGGGKLLEKSPPQENTTLAASLPFEEGLASSPKLAFGSPLDSRYNFDNFVEGASNRVALAAARSVAEAGTGSLRFNPLFIHAGVGLGKTHLLQAIARAALTRPKPAHVVYLTAEYFMWRFASAIRDNDTLSFKERLRAIDLLIIDDMQFLQGKSIQNEFCHLLNSLLDSARQIVVAADRPSAELESLDVRVRSRLSGGVSLEIGQPDYAMRLEMLRTSLAAAKRDEPDLRIREEVLAHIAKIIVGSGRDLEGAFNQILFRQSFEPDLSLARIEEILGHLTRPSDTRRIRIEDIQRLVARHYNVSKQDMLSNRRTRTVVRPRQMAMYLAKILTPRSLPEIGRSFGGRDHTTVLHAVRTVEGRLGGDEKLAQEVELLKRLIHERPA